MKLLIPLSRPKVRHGVTLMARSPIPMRRSGGASSITCTGTARWGIDFATKMDAVVALEQLGRLAAPWRWTSSCRA